MVVGRESVSLRPDYIVTDYEQLRSMADDGCKVESLKNFYPGEFLSGLEQDGEQFMEWLRAMRADGAEMATRILDGSAQTFLNQGDYGAALQLLRESISLEPLKEQSHRRIMKLYAQTGERAMALAQFRSCKELLLQELGAEPDPETTALADAIAAGSIDTLKTLDLPPVTESEYGTVGRPKLPNSPTRKSSTGDESPSIAVLPFINMSGDVEQNYFTDGITEDILTDLSKLSELRVVARGSSFAFKDQPYDLRKVAKELSVDNLVEGSVRKVGDRVRITAQLIDGKSGTHIWAERYDRDLTDIFVVQDEITGKIVNALKGALRPKGRARNSQTQNVDAYDLYLQGRRKQNISSRENLISAKQLFERAISLDQKYVRAYCGISDCNALFYQNYDRSDSLLDEIRETSAKAMELGPDVAEAYASRGFALVLLEDYLKAEKAFRQAVKLDPNFFEAHLYWGRSCVYQGKLEEAVRHYYDALAISPLDYKVPQLLSRTLVELGNMTEARKIAKLTVKNALRKQKQEPDNLGTFLAAGLGYFRSGDVEGAKRQLRLARSLRSNDNLINYNMACLYSLMGDQHNALDYLEKSILDGMNNRSWLETDSDLAPLHGHPRFVAILEAMA